MAKIKTHFQDEQQREVTRSRNYRFTLPVLYGEILDDGRLQTLYAYRNKKNRILSTQQRFVYMPFGERTERQRYVIDLRWRGPRRGNRYNTAREHARTVDVYFRLRQEWPSHD